MYIIMPLYFPMSLMNYLTKRHQLQSQQQPQQHQPQPQPQPSHGFFILKKIQQVTFWQFFLHFPFGRFHFSGSLGSETREVFGIDFAKEAQSQAIGTTTFIGPT